MSFRSPGTRRLRGTGLAALAAAAALTLAACSSGSTAAEDGGDASADFGALTLQLSWIKNAEFAGEFFADSNGYYEDAGFSSSPWPRPVDGAAVARHRWRRLRPQRRDLARRSCRGRRGAP